MMLGDTSKLVLEGGEKSKPKLLQRKNQTIKLTEGIFFLFVYYQWVSFYFTRF